MATDVLSALIHLNLAACAAVLAVMAVRPAVRRRLGAEAAYRLWICVPVAAFAALMPAAAATRIVPPGVGPHFDPVYQASQSLALMPARPILAIWLAGAALGVAVIIYCQARFLTLARRGRAGPAVTGFFVPRIIMPGDAKTRYSDEERVLIRAHERTHIDRGDPRTNGLIAFGQCLLWFNPLIHIAGREARLDQELACDAAVLAHRPGQKRRYAETLLKTQIGAVATPLGCHWLAGAQLHPLERRIQALRQASPDYRRRDWALGLMSVAVLIAAYGAWKAQPAAMAQGMPPVYVPVEAEHMEAIIVPAYYR